MARPSVAAERREQIIDATMSMIAEHGIRGATLDRIADSVGMSRGHVRHFVGNRDRLLLDTAILVFADERGEVESILPPDVDDDRRHSTTSSARSSSPRPRERRRARARRAFPHDSRDRRRPHDRLHARPGEQLLDLVSAAKPDAPYDAQATVAYGMLMCALGSVFLGDFDVDPARLTRSRAAAEALVASL